MSKKIVVESCKDCYESDFECRLGGPHCDRFLFFISLEKGEKIDKRCKLECDEVNEDPRLKKTHKNVRLQFDSNLPTSLFIDPSHIDYMGSGQAHATLTRISQRQIRYSCRACESTEEFKKKRRINNE